MPIVSRDELMDKLQLSGKTMAALLSIGMSITGINALNKLYDELEPLASDSTDFAELLLARLGVDYKVGGNIQALADLASKPFITISNHAYGHLDGVMLIDIFGHIRKDYKVMVNQMLYMIRALQGSFISVQPNDKAHEGVSSVSINGVKAALMQVRNGAPLGLFPSGAVSDLHPKERFTISDRPWQDGALKIIQKLGVPVVPVHFLDGNSMFYYSLGLIDWKVRLCRLIWEMFNKKGKTTRIAIGEVISPEQQKNCGSFEEFSAMLRSSVYDMPVPTQFVNREELFGLKA